MKEKMIVIAGPCVVEDLQTTKIIACELERLSHILPITPILKASYKKANRTKANAFTGIGNIKALQILRNVSDWYGLPCITDVHTPEEVRVAAQYADILQIPAFLCRQTDLIEAAARTGKQINIKKGQFASVDMIYYALGKIRQFQALSIYITERGTTFGYDDLVIDMRNIVILSNIANTHTIIDITHSLGTHDGDIAMMEAIGKSGIAAGANGIFIETHPDPKVAKSDGTRMLPLDMLELVLKNILKVWNSLR
jgi:2-dehydro-3-deoxyphosphooctonate aldolase (KDO 8-P synthase)